MLFLETELNKLPFNTAITELLSDGSDRKL
jgi:hypothetical protein